MFDEQVVRLDPGVKPLLDQFVCVRLVQANGLDLGLFQFDFDLTFGAFFLNGDGTLYGRYGSRSDRKNATKDISIEGFGQALAKVLQWHRGYPANKAQFAGKKPGQMLFPKPEEYPQLKGKFGERADLTDKPLATCIHCHMIQDAQRSYYRDSMQKIPDAVFFPWPMPEVVGMCVDPIKNGRIVEVLPRSAAAESGFETGDVIEEAQGQAIVSTADLQWVLHNAKEGDKLSFKVARGNQTVALELGLPKGWRQGTDISWRASTWDLRRMAFGGLVLVDASESERQSLQIPPTDLALRVDYVGQYGEHAEGKRAGFQKDDVIVQIGDWTSRLSEGAAIQHVLNTWSKGESFPMKARRGPEVRRIQLKVQ